MALNYKGRIMKLISDLGRKTVGAYKASFAIYECPVCKRHTQMNSYNVKHYNTKRCNKCKRSEHLELDIGYVEEIQNILGATQELKHSQEAQQLVRQYAKEIILDIDRYGGRDITARLRTNKADLNFILEGAE